MSADAYHAVDAGAPVRVRSPSAPSIVTRVAVAALAGSCSVVVISGNSEAVKVVNTQENVKTIAFDPAFPLAHRVDLSDYERSTSSAVLADLRQGIAEANAGLLTRIDPWWLTPDEEDDEEDE